MFAPPNTLQLLPLQFVRATGALALLKRSSRGLAPIGPATVARSSLHRPQKRHSSKNAGTAPGVFARDRPSLSEA